MPYNLSCVRNEFLLLFTLLVQNLQGLTQFCHVDLIILDKVMSKPVLLFALCFLKLFSALFLETAVEISCLLNVFVNERDLLLVKATDLYLFSAFVLVFVLAEKLK